MELKIVEKDGVRKFDTTVALANFSKYVRWESDLRVMLSMTSIASFRQSWEEILALTSFELDNARKILTTLEELSYCWARAGTLLGQHFFFTNDGHRALPIELAREERTAPVGYKTVSLDEVKKVECPGCPERRVLIGHYCPETYYEELVICGNSFRVLRRENRGQTP